MLRHLVRSFTIVAPLLIVFACNGDDGSATPQPGPGATGGAQAGAASQAGGSAQGNAQGGKAQAGPSQGGAPAGGNASAAGASAGNDSAGNTSSGVAGAAGAADAAGAAGTTGAAGGADAGGSGGAIASGGSGGSAGGGLGSIGDFVCDPPAKPDELFALSADSLDQVEPVSMCSFRGQVMLIVNVASYCGFTPQYSPLQNLYDAYKAQGLVVLGFPCNQFGMQEPGSDQEISDFCTMKYGITFPMFRKIEVNGEGQHPIYTWLKSQPGGAGDIGWNFTKFLVGRGGKLIARFESAVDPSSPELKAAIESALAEPAPQL